MNLVFSFHDQLFWIHNFLPKNIYKRMYVDFIKNRNKLNLKKTHPRLSIQTWIHKGDKDEINTKL